MCFRFLDFFTVVYMNRTVRKGAIVEARNIYMVFQSTWGTLLCFNLTLCGIFFIFYVSCTQKSSFRDPCVKFLRRLSRTPVCELLLCNESGLGILMDITSVSLDGCVSILCKMYPSYGIKNILHVSLRLF